ncbi:RHS repeat-associated core domain-containing protein, partial [Pseudomonas japonica]
MLLLTDASPSVIGESLAAGVREAVYSAYGEQAEEQRLECLLAFNGELREAGTGWYLLGRGYRAYNPALMRFHSPDSLSPFGEGGLNPYMYCLGNPVRFRDPSGHSTGQARDWDPDYIDPPEQPTKKKSWMDWLPVLGAVIAAVGVMTIALPLLAAPLLTLKFAMGVALTGVAIAAVGTSAAGVLLENEELTAIGYALSAVAGLAFLGGKAKSKWGNKTPKDQPGGSRRNSTQSGGEPADPNRDFRQQPLEPGQEYRPAELWPVPRGAEIRTQNPVSP